MGAVALYGLLHGLGAPMADAALAVGLAASVLSLALFVCTGMIYAAVRFLAEWHTPLTPLNYTLLGSASGFTLASALAATLAPPHAAFLAGWALALTLAGAAGRAASLWRNARLKPRSTLQSAIGIQHPQIVQTSRGFTGGAFNLREFFHGASPGTMRWVMPAFVVLAFALPALLLGLVLAGRAAPALAAIAFALQYAGLLAERWFFFAQANHPQNLYYQAAH
jgi:DMSO reductase anchor subunit